MRTLYGALIAVDTVGAQEHLPPVPGDHAVLALPSHGGYVHHPLHRPGLVLLKVLLVTLEDSRNSRNNLTT